MSINSDGFNIYPHQQNLTLTECTNMNTLDVDKHVVHDVRTLRKH